MTKDEYTKRVDELENELSELKIAYVKANSPFPIGSKVIVHHRHHGANKPTGYDELGIIMGYEINPINEVRPIIAKVKKDGTAHATAKVYVWSSENVKLYNED